MNRILARWSALARPAPRLAVRPEPYLSGTPARGQRLLEHGLTAVTRPSPREAPLTPEEEDALHGFLWLDDLVALGTAEARRKANLWAVDWLRRYRHGSGPGWTPQRAARRLLRWLMHADFLSDPRHPELAPDILRAASHDFHFLMRRKRAAPPGLARIEVLSAIVTGSLALARMRSATVPALTQLAEEADRTINAGGGIAERSPGRLLDILEMLSFTTATLVEAGHPVPPSLTRAIERAAPSLRLLRHADGGLARFHGTATPHPGRLDRALAQSGVRASPIAGAPMAAAMGFQRLAVSRTSLIVDAAPPPLGPASRGAHASTLAFELTSGRRPIVVSCGPGAAFGHDWERAGRATPSHSVLGIEGFSSSRLGTGRDSELLTDGPRNVRAEVTTGDDGPLLTLSHDGYVASHGLTHVRELELTHDGRALRGYDALGAVSDADRQRLDRAIHGSRLQGIHFTIRFHLHPTVDAEAWPEHIALRLRNGEVWNFRQEGAARMTLEQSVYLDPRRPDPQRTHQIVLSGLVGDRAGEVGWTLAKTQDTPLAIRDTEPAEEDLPQARRATRAEA